MAICHGGAKCTNHQPTERQPSICEHRSLRAACTHAIRSTAFVTARGMLCGMWHVAERGASPSTKHVQGKRACLQNQRYTKQHYLTQQNARFPEVSPPTRSHGDGAAMMPCSSSPSTSAHTHEHDTHTRACQSMRNPKSVSRRQCDDLDLGPEHGRSYDGRNKVACADPDDQVFAPDSRCPSCLPMPLLGLDSGGRTGLPTGAGKLEPREAAFVFPRM